MFTILKDDLYYNVRIGERYTVKYTRNGNMICVDGRLIRCELLVGEYD